MTYKEEQKIYRDAASRQEVIKEGTYKNRKWRRGLINSPSDPDYTKKRRNTKRRTKEAVLKIKEKRHLYALARKGML